MHRHLFSSVGPTFPTQNSSRQQSPQFHGFFYLHSTRLFVTKLTELGRHKLLDTTGLILYSSDVNGGGSVNHNELELTTFTIPIFMVSNEDGKYLREIFEGDPYEMR